jgi:hypothetical protein
VSGIWFNVCNNNFYNLIYTSRQLLVDTGSSGDPFSFADLFLHGPETLIESQSYRPPNIAQLPDHILLTGPISTVASGRIVSLAYVPPAPAPLPILGVGAGLAWSRRLRRRIVALPQGAGLKRQGCDHPDGRWESPPPTGRFRLALQR